MGRGASNGGGRWGARPRCWRGEQTRAFHLFVMTAWYSGMRIGLRRSWTMNTHVARPLALLVLLAGFVAPRAAPPLAAAARSYNTPASRADHAFQTSDFSLQPSDDLAVTGTPFPNIGFYYGGPAIGLV